MFFFLMRCLIPSCVDTDGLISQALLTGNFEAAVDVCLYADRMVWLKSLHFKHTLSLSLTERTCDTRTKIRTRARERELETRYVAGTHCPRNQLNGMARAPSMDPQI